MIIEYGAHTRGGEKTPHIIQRPELSKNMQFDAVADIYLAKSKDEVLIACKVSQWDNSIAGYLHKIHINKIKLTLAKFRWRFTDKKGSISSIATYKAQLTQSNFQAWQLSFGQIRLSVFL